MNLLRKNIFNKFKWLKEEGKPFIISADYDGIICSAFLSHYLKWDLVGYYNMENIWVSNQGIDRKKDLIWVDLNIVPKIGRAIGGHITILEDEMPKGLNTSCNPNILQSLNNNDFNKKFPFSTLCFLMWLFKTPIPQTEIARFFILHSDASWLKYQKYSNNIENWISLLEDYNWPILFKNINSIDFEKRVDQELYPMLLEIGALSGFSKLQSNHLHIKSRECKLNPDWDEDVVLNLLALFGQHLSWSPPSLPSIKRKINGKKIEVALNKVKKTGLKKFIQDNKIFSYAITSPSVFKYTVFDAIK